MDHNSKQSNLFEINKVITLPLEEEIKQSYLNYAMSVIVGRALPDARDGLKPVQRRILYAMMELGVRHNQPFKKSARIVGETMGKYHPHGDAAIYDTMARLSQDFSMRYTLVDGQGNFGSIDGDPPAAMRYTEARLHALGEEMLADINEDTIDWGPNFDESLQEPLVLPSRIPNLLVNGSTGIAVGMATNMPPHNLGEAIDVCCAVLDDPEVELGELMTLMPGPDFPTGGIILGRDGIIDAYRTGRGKIIVRGRVEIEEPKKGKRAILITEIPYMVNKTNFIETIAKGAQTGIIDGISDLRDESDRNGMRIVVELQRDADPNLVLRQLYSRTQLQTTFGVINLAIVDGGTKELPLKDMVLIFLNHRREVVRRRTEFRLRKAEDRRHIVEGLLRALDAIDRVIAIIRGSSDAATARSNLVSELDFTEIQAQAILDMRLQRLTGLEREKLDDELAQLLMDIERYHSILSSHVVLDSVVKSELQEVKAAYSDKRRTDIENDVEEVAAEDLIPEEEIVVALTRDGYIRRMPLQDYRVQQRGGKGVKGVRQGRQGGSYEGRGRNIDDNDDYDAQDALSLHEPRARIRSARLLAAGAKDRQGQAHRHDSDARKGREGRRHEGQRARGREVRILRHEARDGEAPARDGARRAHKGGPPRAEHRGRRRYSARARDERQRRPAAHDGDGADPSRKRRGIPPARPPGAGRARHQARRRRQRRRLRRGRGRA